MYNVKIDTVKLLFPISHYNSLKKYYQDNGYKLRADDKNKYISKVFLPSLRTSLLKIYQSFNNYSSGCYIEIYGLCSYNELFDKEKELITKLTLSYIEENDLSKYVRINNIDVAIDLNTTPSLVQISRKKLRGRKPSSVNKNIHENCWFKKNTLYIESTQYQCLRYKNENNNRLHVPIQELEYIVKQNIYDINSEYKKDTHQHTIHKFKLLFKEKHDFYLDKDYFFIKNGVQSRYEFGQLESKFSREKLKNVSYGYLYDKAHKEALEYPLSRFEIKIKANDLKSKKSLYTPLKSHIMKILNRYEIKVSGKEILIDEDKIISNILLLLELLNNSNN